MAINLTLRLVKGSPLTLQEGDNNFIALKNAIDSLSNGSNLIKGTNGYIKFNNNWMIQWGAGTTVTGKMDTVTFPVSFKTKCSCVVVCEMHSAGWDWTFTPPDCAPTIYGVTNATTSGFKISGVRVITGSPPSEYQGGMGYNYLAFGY